MIKELIDTVKMIPGDNKLRYDFIEDYQINITITNYDNLGISRVLFADSFIINGTVLGVSKLKIGSPKDQYTLQKNVINNFISRIHNNMKNGVIQGEKLDKILKEGRFKGWK